MQCAVHTGVVDDSVVAWRPRESTYPLVSVDEAVRAVMAEASVMSVENVHLTGQTDFSYHLLSVANFGEIVTLIVVYICVHVLLLHKCVNSSIV